MPTSREKHARGGASSPRGWRRRVVETLVVIAVIVAMVGVQGLIEAGITTVVGGAVSTALFRFDKGVRK